MSGCGGPPHVSVGLSLNHDKQPVRHNQDRNTLSCQTESFETAHSVQICILIYTTHSDINTNFWLNGRALFYSLDNGNHVNGNRWKTLCWGAELSKRKECCYIEPESNRNCVFWRNTEPCGDWLWNKQGIMKALLHGLLCLHLIHFFPILRQLSGHDHFHSPLK